MLQHANINTFVRHYSVGIHVNAQAIVRGLPQEKRLMRFACSMSRSIDPRRPYKLATEDSNAINKLPRVCALQELVQKRKQARDLCFGKQKKYERADQKYRRALRELRNEKQRQRNRQVRENLERYKNEQPVIDSERQLAGKVVDEEVIGALQQTGYMTPQHMMLIDTILTMPGATIEAEYSRPIAAINAVIAFCDVEEGAPLRPIQSRKRPTTDAVTSTHAKRQECSQEDADVVTLHQAIASVQISSPGQRPMICFLCVGNPGLPMEKRTRKYSTPGSLSRHVRQTHVRPRWPEGRTIKCNICRVELENKRHLMHHAECLLDHLSPHLHLHRDPSFSLSRDPLPPVCPDRVEALTSCPAWQHFLRRSPPPSRSSPDLQRLSFDSDT